MSPQLAAPPPRYRWVISGILAGGLTLALAVMSFAVHDLKFQLDGNVTTEASPPGTYDWADFFDANGDPKSLPAGFTNSGFVKDFKNNGNTFITSDDTTFATGSKDILPISTGWQCNRDNNVNSAIDILNAYATAYTDTNGDQIVYFALERNFNNGDANVGFWFLQDNVGCSSPGGAVNFTGAHMDGDLLIVSAFTKGGAVSTIDVYRWNGDASGSLGTTPVAHGVDCRDPATAGGDSACAAVNNATITTPWLTATKQGGVGHSLLISDFYEGGLNLTKSNLGGKCFNVFIGDTRSSQSLTATLFDYARGVIGECTSTTVTTPSVIGSVDIPADPGDASISVTDSATITVTGASSFTGSVSWHLCGPTDPASTQLCDGTTGNVGVDVGSKAVTASPTTISSDPAIVTQAGRYCWRAEFSATAPQGIPSSSDSRASECFVVDPRQPTLTTQATTGPVAFGGKISDSVTLSNTAHKPGTGGPAGSNGSINPTTLGGDATGNITVVAYGPNSCTTVAFTSAAIAASGDGTYGGAGSAFEFTPSSPGQYVFVAAYAGDLPNTKAIAATACTAAPNSEKVTVQQIPTTIKTKQSWYPNDTATIAATAGNLAANGTVAFSLYDNATCTGTAKYTESKTLAGGSPTEEVSTNNTTFNITTLYTAAADSVVTYSWKVVYTPAAADTAHTGKQSACNAEHFSITYTNDNGPGSNLP